MLAVMSTHELRRFPAFAALSEPALAALAAEVRRLRLPPRRWLVQPGRTLSGHYYLLQGRVRLHGRGGAEVLAAGSPRAREPVYPGPAGVETLTAAIFLQLDPEALALPWEPQHLGLPELSSDDSAWQRRFLSSPLMQRLDPVTWQRVLRAMTADVHDAGARVVETGARADCCYVLCAGRAEIRGPGKRRLAVVEPGQLFGEDALVTRGVRNADVVMVTPGATVKLAAARFEQWLLAAVVRPLAVPDGRCLITLDGRPGSGRLSLSPRRVREHAGELSPALCYGVVGGTRRERALVCFLLAELGIDARPVERPAPVTPAPSGPGPSA
jgi:CRP-like cAMP-binding protein